MEIVGISEENIREANNSDGTMIRKGPLARKRKNWSEEEISAVVDDIRIRREQEEFLALVLEVAQKILTRTGTTGSEG